MAGEIDGLQPVIAHGVIAGKLDFAIQIHRVKRKINALNIAPVQSVLDFRAGQENIGDAHADDGFGDAFDLLLRLLIVARLAFLEFPHEAAEQFEGFFVIRLLAPAAALERDDAAIAGHPFGVIVKRIIIPIRGLAGLDGRLELLRHALALNPIATLIAQRHGDQIMRVGAVLLGLGNLERVFQDFERRLVAVVTEVVGDLRLQLRRVRHGPNNFQIPLARQLNIRRACPPIERRLVMRPGLAPIVRIPPCPVIIAQRFLHLHPDAIMILNPLNVPDEHLKLLAGVVQLRGVGSVRV